MLPIVTSLRKLRGWPWSRSSPKASRRGLVPRSAAHFNGAVQIASRHIGERITGGTNVEEPANMTAETLDDVVPPGEPNPRRTTPPGGLFEA